HARVEADSGVHVRGHERQMVDAPPSRGFRYRHHGRLLSGLAAKGHLVHCPAGGMRERPNRMVSKTIVPPGTVGSNPTPSAISRPPGSSCRRGGSTPIRMCASRAAEEG